MTLSPVATSKPEAKQTRMTLDAVKKGKLARPFNLLCFGTEGIGKSSFAAGAPSPIFLPAEDGTDHLDVARFPKPESWEQVLEAIHTLYTLEHEYKTFVIDTLDAVEPLLWSHMIRRDRTEKNQYRDIEDYGYGKGYQKALDDWRILLAGLESLRLVKGMNIVLLAHSSIRTFKNPEGEDFDRYELKLNPKAGALLKEWVDDVLFANYETYAVKSSPSAKKAKGVSSGARIAYTHRTAAYDAKHRHGLPESFPLSWDEYEAAALSGVPVALVTLRAEIAKKAKLLGPTIEAKAEKLVEDAGDDGARLAQIDNRLTAKLAEKEG